MLEVIVGGSDGLYLPVQSERVRVESVGCQRGRSVAAWLPR